MAFKLFKSAIQSKQSEQSSSNDKHTSLKFNNDITTLGNKLQNTFLSDSCIQLFTTKNNNNKYSCSGSPAFKSGSYRLRFS